MKYFYLALAALVMTQTVHASEKICFGSKRDEGVKGSVILATILPDSIVLKMVKGDFRTDGTYPAIEGTVNGRDGETYLQYLGEDTDYQEIILVDQKLLKSGTTGLLQFRARGEGFFNSAFVCRDNRR